MVLRPRHFDYDDVASRLSNNRGYATLMILVALVGFLFIVVGGITYSVSESHQLRTSHEHEYLMRTVNSVHDPTKRMLLAKEILYMHTQPISVVTLDSQEVKHLQTVAKDGSRLVLEHPHPHVGRDFWQRDVPLTLAAIYGLFSMILFASYGLQSRKRHEGLLDIRWNEGWVYPSVFFTALPLGWPFYVVSAVRVRKARKRLTMPTHQQIEVVHTELEAAAQWADQALDPFATELEQTEQQHEPSYRFFSAPQAARSLYRKIRTMNRGQVIASRRDQLRQDQQDVEERLRNAGEEIRLLQGQRNEVRVAQAELEKMELDTEPPDLAHLNIEFDRLLNLRGVEGVRVVNDSIAVLVKPQIVYEGTVYDLGDWEIRFDASPRLFAKELRTGVRRSWDDGYYPAYRLGNGHFCFGDRATVISNNLNKGQFLEAVEVAVDCLHSVNDVHLYRIPEAFKEAK
ncbi:MAG: hypothetical protein JWS12_612 [Candidatus Saccharibacteria bacterium]|nr:hypothetical protein [Candidatus Saccharibacteria bacterium]